MAILNPFRWIGPRNVCGAEVRYVLKFVEVLAALCKIAEKTLIALGWLIPTITKNYMVYNQLYLIRHFKQRKGVDVHNGLVQMCQSHTFVVVREIWLVNSLSILFTLGSVRSSCNCELVLKFNQWKRLTGTEIDRRLVLKLKFPIPGFPLCSNNYVFNIL